MLYKSIIRKHDKIVKASKQAERTQHVVHVRVYYLTTFTFFIIPRVTMITVLITHVRSTADDSLHDPWKLSHNKEKFCNYYFICKLCSYGIYYSTVSSTFWRKCCQH